MVGYLVADLVGILQGIPYDLKYQSDKAGTVRCIVRLVECLIVFLLPRLDKLLYRKPVEQLLPFPQKEGMPHPSHSSVAISKWMDEFKLIMEYRALDQWMKTGFHVPVDEIVDQAGNEFRRMEIVAVNYPTMGVARVEYFDPFYHATLYTDEPRTDAMYLYDKTQNGRFTIRNAEADDSNGRADYIVTHFSLATGEPLTGGKIYVDGEFTNHQFSPDALMNYDAASGCYVADILLKQGAYNYQYLFVPDGTGVGLTSTIEGDKYHTVNEYSVRVYNRRQGERYDRMIGFGMVFSGR